ncbi:MAG: hypothetical protein EXS10_10355 [Phycisphaerales bacterium]|nr:hypothetical protein [Phycisphaerales bacterium]
MLTVLCSVSLCLALAPQSVISGGAAVKPKEPQQNALTSIQVLPPAPARASEPTAAPGIWVTAWSNVPGGLRYVTPMVWLRDTRSGFENFGNSGTQPLPIDRVAQELRQLPKGRRAIHLWYYRDGLLTDPSDRIPQFAAGMRSPWPTNAETRIRSQWAVALSALVSAGAKPELLVLDNEEAGHLTNWHLTPSQISVVMDDARFNDAFLQASTASVSSSPSLYTGATYAGPQSGPGYLAWNLVIQSITNEVMDRALWQPARARFPELKGSNYQASKISAAHASPDFNGHAQPLNHRFGTSSAPALYGMLEGAARYCSIDPADRTRLRLGVGGTPIGKNAWMAFLLDVQTGRAVRRSDAAPMQPWICSPSWVGDAVGTTCYKIDPRYYDEMVRHVSLLRTETFLLWNPPELVGGVETTISRDRRHAEARALDIVLSDINRRLNERPAEPLDASRLPWDARIIATGAKVGANSYLWRVSVKPEVRSFQVGSGGPIVQLPAGAVGVWLTSARPELPTLRAIGGETTAVATAAAQ